VASLAPFTQVAQMHLIVVSPTENWRLHFNIVPLLQPIHRPVDVRLLINLRLTERFAPPAALMENPHIVSILLIESYIRGDDSTRPAGAAASRILALEVAYDIGVDGFKWLARVFDFVETEAQRLDTLYDERVQVRPHRPCSWACPFDRLWRRRSFHSPHTFYSSRNPRDSSARYRL
jgi:hypothetical protein